MKNQPNKATVKDGWKLTGHSYQIADTGDYDGHYEITNGKISLLTQDDDDEALQPIVDALNDSGCKFYQDDWLEFENKILKDENAELRERVSKLETENKDYYLRVKELEFVGQVDSDCIESQSNEIDDLKAWKESAMKELNAIDLQSLGKKLGIGLGQSVSENVHAKIDGLLERVKELEESKAQDLSFLIEIRDRFKKSHLDVVQREYVEQMLSDWIVELEGKK